MALPQGVQVHRLPTQSKAQEWVVIFPTHYSLVRETDDEAYCIRCQTVECEHVYAVLEFEVPSEEPWTLTEPVRPDKTLKALERAKNYAINLFDRLGGSQR